MSKQQVRARLLDVLQQDIILPPMPADMPEALAAPMAAGHNAALRQVLASAVCIEASNVARYFDETYINDDRGADDWHNDLKCLAPPHRKFFIEWEHPNIPTASRMGVLFVACEAHEAASVVSSLVYERGIGSTLEQIAAFRANVLCKWIYITLDFLEFEPTPGIATRLRGPFHVGTTSVAEDGTVLGYYFQIGSSIQRHESIQVAAAGLVGWTALSMLNCQNITTDEHHAPEAFQRSRVKNKKRPLVSYHTIRVDLSKTPRSIAADELPGSGPSPRRHVKRGHMKDYRKNKGLFGKYKGVWYWGPQLVGSATDGVVISDYEVKP